MVSCHVANKFMVVMCYADDLTIIPPSHISMEIMLQIFEDFDMDYQVKFNSTKSILITNDAKHEVSFIIDNYNISRLEKRFT